MPTQITSHKVFIASPGGLGQEREEFQATLQKHNQADALARACMFEPIGWEITLGGVGRPQEKINEELRQCDYFVLVLWDRWGSPTGSKEGHTSGTAEEYSVALSCLSNSEFPLREIVVFFKAVDARQLSDPGPQLQTVLNFKKELEENKTTLFETFDTPESFGEKLRRHLSKWTRYHEATQEQGGHTYSENTHKKAKKGFNSIDKTDLSSGDPKDTSFIADVEKIYRSGNLTEAEQKLVSDLISKRTIDVFYSYGLFLQKAERFSDAARVFSEMSKVAQAELEIGWAGTAEARLGLAYRIQGKAKLSQDALERAIGFKQAAGDDRGEMSAYIWLGDLHLQYRRYDKALISYQSALAFSSKFPEKKLAADIHFKCAKCFANLGHVEEALVEGELAKQAYMDVKDKLGVKAIKSWRRDKGLNKPIIKNP